jgi:outer membrane protein assembly factor BamB
MVIGIIPMDNSNDASAYMFRGDPQRTGIYDSIVFENSSLIWSYDTRDIVESTPVVYDNKVYVGSENGRLYCLDAYSGLEIWNYKTGNEVDSTPTIFDDAVYFGSSDMKLYALDANSGDEHWNYSFESTLGQIVSSPVISHNSLFIGSKDGNLYSLNLTTHELEWTFSTGDEIWGSAAVSWPYVYIGSLDGNLYCLWGTNGTQKWNFSSNLTKPLRGIYTTPMISNGRLYIGSEDDNLYRLNAETGDMIWNFSAPRHIYSSASVSDGRVFIHSLGSPNGFLFALPEEDPNGDGVITDNEVLWSFETGDWDGGSSPALADGKVVVGSRDRNLYCLNQSTGEKIWNFTTGDGIVSSPTISYGIIYFSSRDGNVYAVGGFEQTDLEIQIIPEFDSIKSNRIMGISFLVTHRGNPVEGAFITVDISFGNLSQYGASTFPDGTQRVKYTAPLVHENHTVSAHATATKFGFPEGESTVEFTVISSGSSQKVSSQSTFSLSKYWYYLVLISVLLIINIIILVIRFKKRKKNDPQNKSDSNEKSDK